MTISELHIQLDLQPKNRISILEVSARKCNEGYLFVDSSDGHCYLFDENGNEDDVKKLKKIDDGLFYYSNIKSIIIPDSVKSIGDRAFWNCESLRSVVIPDSVERIEYGALASCKNLKSIVIPDSVKSIGDDAFWFCKNLKSIIIPNSVKKIGFEAFGYCESLKSVSFKGKTIDKVKSMDNYPFGIEDESIIKCI